MKIGVGIDTGGTYTDAVIYDFDQKQILGTAKALTTKEDLSLGISEALDQLPKDCLSRTEVISLSTTLATNACVEDKGGRGKLIFLGGDPNIIREFGEGFGLPPAEEIYVQESYTTFSGEFKQEMDWELFRRNVKEQFQQLDGAAIVEQNAMKNGAVIEKKAKKIFQETVPIPVVCGHELFSELSGLKRCASTLLNAELFPVIDEFLDAMKRTLTQRGMKPSVVIVRSDGSLMSEEFAKIRPVETLLCGPAASVMGGISLTDAPNSIIVDMGGTTTDIAVVKQNVPIKAVDGVNIGKWKTFVNGIYLKTFGLGGDSAIHYDDHHIFLEEYRVVPLCVAAHQYPYITQNLKQLVQTVPRHTRFLHEHYLLIKDISGEERYTQEEKEFCAALKQGPLMIREAAQAVGKDVYNLNVSRLLKEGVVALCGLTPTDIMHIKQDFKRYDAEASYWGAQFVAAHFGNTVEELCDFIYEEIKRKLYLNIVKVLLENQYPHYLKNGVNQDVERFINEGYERSRQNKTQDFLSFGFHTDFTLVGIGAPIHIFLNDVASKLGAKSVIPPHSEVANALGAIAGNITAEESIEIRSQTLENGNQGYAVFASEKKVLFEDLEQAEAFALTEAEQAAREEAVRRGVKGDITVKSHVIRDTGSAMGASIYLGSRAVAQAVGSIGF